MALGLLREYFLEETRHRIPRPFIGQLLILKCGIVESGGVGVGEVMLHTTVCNHLPVNSRGRHLCLKSIDLIERYQLIIPACTHQNPGFYLTSLRGAFRMETAMKAHDTAQRCALAREFERKVSTHTQSDRRKPRRIDLRERSQLVERRHPALAQHAGVAEQRMRELYRVGQVVQLASVSIIVARERDVAQRCEPFGFCPGMNAGATYLRHYDDAGALAADLVVVRQISQEANVAIFVFHCLRLHLLLPIKCFVFDSKVETRRYIAAPPNSIRSSPDQNSL